jgi:ABC-type lipoprotein export system ATPase subunit
MRESCANSNAIDVGGTALRFTHVGKSFVSGSTTVSVLSNIDLLIASGQMVALVGPSGSGKSTLLAIAVGWEEPTTGDVAVLGGDRPPGCIPWHELAIVPQALGLLDELTVAENITLPLRLMHRDTAPAALLMNRLGIDHLAGRFSDQISLGEQQRVALARAAVLRPLLLVADEPTAHQNRARSEDMMMFLRELTTAGTACLIATHDVAAIGAVDRVLELHNGTLRRTSSSRSA